MKIRYSRKVKVFLILVIFVFLNGFNSLTYGQEHYRYRAPSKLDDNWQTANLLSKNKDSTRIYQLFDQLIPSEHDVHSVLAVQGGELLLEEYYPPYNPDAVHDLRSVNKSIISILMGIAIDNGFINSIDDPIFNYLDKQAIRKNQDKRKENILIKHLLIMSTGLDCNDWDKSSLGQEDRVYRKKDWLQYTLDLPMLNSPGAVSNYCSMGVVLAAEIISRASGMRFDDFARQYLFEPLDIKHVEWGHTSNKEVIPAAKRMYMRPRDMAKVGQLILNDGKWNGKVVVSEQWLKQATGSKVKIGGMDYGFLWWQIPLKVDDRIVNSITATGNGGQYIMIFKEYDIVLVFTGGAFNSEKDKLPFAIARDVLLPTLMD